VNDRPWEARESVSAGRKEGVDWYREIAGILEETDGARLPQRLLEGLARLVPFDMAAVFVYRGRSRPLLVHDSFEPAEAKKGLAAYTEGTYVLNPIYQALLRGLKPGVYRIRDLAPDAFFDQALCRSYRVTPRASEEIGFITEHWPEDMEEIGIVAALEDETVAEICLFRRPGGKGFGDDELTRLAAVHPVVAALLRGYWRNHGAAGSRASPPDARVDDAFAGFGAEVLSEREREVAQMILRGHSSESIGFNLGISLGTVKTHRRNAYAKLEISSQSELLSLFLRSLEAP
jgi:DNA-binding CsgD family transcriptional regulator